MHKRYTIFNFYIRGSNQSPQACHALNNLWKQLPDMREDARSLFLEWANESETEVMLQGGDDKDLEALYDAMSKIDSIPSAKFNEEALRDVCTVVTFVASQRIVIANNHIRNNRISPFNAAKELKNTVFTIGNDLSFTESFSLTDEEIFVVSKVAFLPLAN